MGLIYLPIQERTASSDALLPSRNTGLVLSGNAFNERVSWAGGLFNDWLDSDDSFGESSNQFVGRLSWMALASSDESNLLHLGAGLRYSDTNEGLFFATEPEFNQSALYIDTGSFEAESALTWNLEASWRKGPVWVAAEYVQTDVDAAPLDDPSFVGYHVTASWALTGEMRDYNRNNGTFNPLPVARSVYNNGPGAWELAARWSELDTNDGLINGGKTDIFSIGLNWWLNPFFNVSANYRWITLLRQGVAGESDGFNTRIVVMLE